MCGMAIFDERWCAWVFIFQFSNGDEKETQSDGPLETIFFFSLA